MNGDASQKIHYIFDRQRNLAGARFATARLAPSTRKLSVGALSLAVGCGCLYVMLRPDEWLVDNFDLPEDSGPLIGILALTLFSIAYCLVVPKLARNLSLRDYRRRWPDGYEVTVTQTEGGLEWTWQNTRISIGWADTTEIMLGNGHLILVQGATLVFPIPLSQFSSDDMRAFVRACAAHLSPVALERSRKAIGPFLV